MSTIRGCETVGDLFNRDENWGTIVKEVPEICRAFVIPLGNHPVPPVDEDGNYHQHNETMDGRRFGEPMNTTVQAMGYKDTKEFLVEMKRRKLPFDKIDRVLIGSQKW